MSHPEIGLLPARAATDQSLVAEVTVLVNLVYADAEAGLWLDGTTRTTTVEVEQMIASHQIAVARVDGHVVGCIRVRQLDGTVGEFGLLVAHPERRGDGLGRELVRFAEELSLQRGLATMQLELLVPRGWSHPTKVFLHRWYVRMGYRPARTARMEESYPHLAPRLATPCDLVLYHKPLTLWGRPGTTPQLWDQRGWPCGS